VAKDHRSKGKGRAAPAASGSRRSVVSQRLSSPAVGWEAYRGWLGQLERNAGRRQGPDSIYTWKGYQAWTAKVRADWDPEG
jgi:ABC-type Fe3+ transport system substrate-binding protein